MDDRDEVITMPKGANVAGVRGSGRSSNGAGGLIEGRGIFDEWWLSVSEVESYSCRQYVSVQFLLSMDIVVARASGGKRRQWLALGTW